MVVWQEFVLLTFAGFVTGIVNTLSGSGTLFSLGALIMLDVPLILANTSNRPGVFFQNLSGLISIRNHGRLGDFSLPWDLVVITTIGAVTGAYLAISIPENLLLIAATTAMIFALCLTLFPILINRQQKEVRVSRFMKWVVFGLVGLYGGFIQIGVGLLMLAVISKWVSKDFKQANVLKLFLILIYTIPTTIYFIFKDQILWNEALFLATGQLLGAYLAGFFIAVSKYAVVASKVLTVVFIILTLVKIWLVG